jgi:hypothetical protein
MTHNKTALCRWFGEQTWTPFDGLSIFMGYLSNISKLIS